MNIDFFKQSLVELLNIDSPTGMCNNIEEYIVSFHNSSMVKNVPNPKFPGSKRTGEFFFSMGNCSCEKGK